MADNLGNIYVATRVKIKSFESHLLDIACNSLKNIIQGIDGRIVGPLRLPTSKHYYCVLNSPHVDKKSREQFEISEYSRLIDIYTPKELNHLMDTFLTIPVPPGVSIEII